ncbi:hypothetical protein Cgig2_015698 [Carnegiea gigantea]|uniref:Uncharacterized protein n=1 Tax=Carnegiea gigantea TaxID=171969 RepID=A0A9Q1JZX7_9CARY|nr:hypothetical protein Cgig2_015698 [Carnegiea gigantea]
MAEGYTLSLPGEETWASLSLSSIDNCHTSIIHKSNIRLSPAVKCKGIKFGQRLDVSFTDQRRLSLTYSATCMVSRQEGKEAVLPLEGPPANTGFSRRSVGREAWALWSLRSLSPSHASTGPQSNFRMAHITQSMVSLPKRPNSAASSITMA